MERLSLVKGASVGNCFDSCQLSDLYNISSCQVALHTFYYSQTLSLRTPESPGKVSM